MFESASLVRQAGVIRRLHNFFPIRPLAHLRPPLPARKQIAFATEQPTSLSYGRKQDELLHEVEETIVFFSDYVIEEFPSGESFLLV